MATARGRELLTSDQKLEFMRIPAESEWELGTYYTFSQHDLEIINNHRRDHNRLGFAVQLAVLRYPGWPLSDLKEIPGTVLSYIAKQINVNPDAFSSYALREQTRREHIEEIRQEYGYRNFTTREHRILAQNLLHHAMENGQIIHLIQMAIDELRKRKVILPAMTTIERVVWEARHRAEEKIFKNLNSSLTELQKQKLDKTIEVESDESKTILAWLREVPGQSSPEAFLKVVQRLEYIREMNLTIQTEGIHPNRLLQLSRLGARYKPHSFRRFKADKKYAILVLYLLNLSQDLIDQAFEIHDRQITLLLSKGRKAQEEMQKQNGKTINEKVVLLADLGAALIKARNEGIDPYVALEAVRPRDQLVTSVEEAKKISRPIDYDYLDLLEKRFFYLRKYTPTLLKALEFRSTQSAAQIAV